MELDTNSQGQVDNSLESTDIDLEPQPPRKKVLKRASFAMDVAPEDLEDHLEFHIKAHDIEEIGEFSFAKRKLSHLVEEEEDSKIQESEEETVEEARANTRRRSIMFTEVPAHINSSPRFVHKVHEFEKGEFRRAEDC
jgi:hypothetical protein